MFSLCCVLLVLQGWNGKSIDIYGSGAPCQPFSGIGLGAGPKDVRARVLEKALPPSKYLSLDALLASVSCWMSFPPPAKTVNRISSMLPTAFLFENVPRLASKKYRGYFKKLLNRTGYVLLDSPLY